MAEHGVKDGRASKRRTTSHELPPDHKVVRDPRFNTKRVKGAPARAARAEAVVADPAPANEPTDTPPADAPKPTEAAKKKRSKKKSKAS